MAKKKTQQSSLFKWMIGLVVGAVFIGLRIFSLQQSFWFWGDMGRDFFVLQNWAQQPFHPPLLGPQTSVFSFNHSAWYYYLLFPFFILTGHSPYATYIAILTSYAAIFIGDGFQKETSLVTIYCSVLFTSHPSAVRHATPLYLESVINHTLSVAWFLGLVAISMAKKLAVAGGFCWQYRCGSRTQPLDRTHGVGDGGVIFVGTAAQ